MCLVCFQREILPAYKLWKDPFRSQLVLVIEHFEYNIFENNIMYFSSKQEYKLLANGWMNPIFQFDL